MQAVKSPRPSWERVRERGNKMPVNLTETAKELRKNSTDAEQTFLVAFYACGRPSDLDPRVQITIRRLRVISAVMPGHFIFKGLG